MTILKRGASRILLALGLVLSLLAGIWMSGISANAESLDLLRSDFRNGSDSWTLNELTIASSDGLEMLPGGQAQTVGTMDSLLMFIEFGSVSAGFTLELGVTGEGAACSLTFDGDILRAEGVADAGGENSVVLDRIIGADSILKVEMIGGYIEVSVKNADDAYDLLGTPVATLYFAEGPASREGNIVLSQPEGTAVIRTADLYSLSGSIHIDTEDEVVEPEPPEQPETPDEGGLAPWAIALIVVGGVVVVAAVIAAVLLIKKKKGGSHEENH